MCAHTSHSAPARWLRLAHARVAANGRPQGRAIECGGANGEPVAGCWPTGLAQIVGVACVVLLLAAGPAAAVPPGKHRTVGKLATTASASYRIVQNGREMGIESYEEQMFDNNTIVFKIESALTYGQGVGLSQKTELTLEDESHFPRTLHVIKTITQPSGSFEHRIDVEMFANVAVVSSSLNNVKDSRQVVVPTGLALEELGVLSSMYQTLFWYDRTLGGRQRFQWLDPVSAKIGAGEIYLSGQETIDVLGKKTIASVFKLERENFGPATLWVDAQGMIVRGEQNLSIFELVDRTNH